MNNPKLLGWRMDTHDPRDYPVGQAIFEKPVRELDTQDQTRYVGDPIVQVGQSCVGCAIARAIQMSLAIQGKPAFLPSPSFIYATALATAQPVGGLALDFEDLGCYPRVAMQGVRRKTRGGLHIGVPDWRDCSFADLIGDFVVRAPRPKHQTACVPLADFEYFRVGGYYQDRLEAIRDARAAGYVVVGGILVDKRFIDHTGPEPIRHVDYDGVLGGHMFTILDLTKTDGLIDNWWGTEWGVAGRGWLSTALLGSDLASDFYAIRA
jgi:hypothetical protein